MLLGFEAWLDWKPPLFISSNVAVSVATDFSGYQVLFALALTLAIPLLLLILSLTGGMAPSSLSSFGNDALQRE